MEPPAVISSASSGSDGPAIAPKVLHAGSSQSVEQAAKGGAASAAFCRLNYSPVVPERHVCIVLGERGNIDGASDWDLVRQVDLCSLPRATAHPSQFNVRASPVFARQQ